MTFTIPTAVARALVVLFALAMLGAGLFLDSVRDLRDTTKDNQDGVACIVGHLSHHRSATKSHNEANAKAHAFDYEGQPIGQMPTIDELTAACDPFMEDFSALAD